MSHSGCALVWHVQPRVVIFPCHTHYHPSSVNWEWVQEDIEDRCSLSGPNCCIRHSWFQVACNPRNSHGCQCSAVLHLLLYIVKQQLTLCFKSSKPIQIGLCMLMSLNIHLHGLHLDAHMVRHDICRHIMQWREDWSSASVVNHTIVTNPTIQQPGFNLPRHTWSLMNRFQTGRGPCRVNLYKSPSCDYGQRQTMNHIVNTCPLTKFDGGLNLLHEADDDAVIWLESTATVALAK